MSSNNLRITQYESLAEVRDLIIDGGDVGSSNVADRSSGYGHNNPGNAGEWAGGGGINDCAEMLLHGWQDQDADFHEEVDRLLVTLEDKMNDFIQEQSKTVLDVSGGWVDVDRFIAGDPENMYESWMEPEVTKGKALKVLLNIAASNGVSPEAIKRRGFAVAAAVQAVSTMGFNVEMWVGESTHSTGEWRARKHCNVEIIKVKDYFDPLDEEVAMFMCAHPGMLRRICFWLNEQHEAEFRKGQGFGPESGGYGVPAPFPKELHEQFDLVIERGEAFSADEVVDQLLITNDEDRLNEYR